MNQTPATACQAAYRALLADKDPARGWIESGAPDERFGSAGVGGAVYRGVNDLCELRAIVERITGPGSWPAPAPVDGECVGTTVALRRPADVMGLLQAAGDEITDRAAMWRTWETTLEAIANAVVDLHKVTVEACRASSRSRFTP